MTDTNPVSDDPDDDANATDEAVEDAGALNTGAPNTGAPNTGAPNTGAPNTGAPNTGADVPEDDDDGPGCMPAVLAATALMGIAGFIFCAFSTWILYQKRTELAIRTLNDAYLPEIEQSLLDPETKAGISKEIKALSADMQRGKYEDWQSAGVMQRLQRLPVLQWGELQAVEAFLIENGTTEQATEAKRQFDRLRLSVKDGKTTSFDFFDVLEPVSVADDSVPTGRRLARPIELELAMDVVKRAELLADRAQVPEEYVAAEVVSIEAIMRAEIQQGISEGSF